ncbi:MAG: tripartite tricarboxylate transporter permease [Eubacteriales bacterium]|nr:tripartite tricarboxylate transporter permease [Eubacteriales bacterium]
MENILALFQGFSTALTPANLIAAMAGCFMGIVVGAMPGIGSLAGCSLLLPLTFHMEPVTGIIMLAGIYYGNMFGGAFSAILLNIPGDAPAVMTALDGYAMTRKNKGGKALFAANVASFIGGTIGIIILTFLAPTLAKIGLKFGPAEMTTLLLLAFCSIGWMMGDDPKYGLISTFFGAMLALIGMDPVNGATRFTGGNVNLFSGLTFIPVVIGMFGFSQVIEMFLNRSDFSFLGGEKLTIRGSLLNRKEMQGILPNAIRSGVLGCFIGVLPGAGATIASFISYMTGKRISKEGKHFGEGVVEGIACSEAANNSAAAGAFAPLLSLGIPGSGTAAVLLGGLMMWGLQPGPRLFAEQGEFCWGLIASMYIGNVVCILIAIAVIPFLTKILKVPAGIMSPIIITLCVVGAYAANNNMFDVYVMIFAGFIGYFLNKNKYPIAPLLLAFVLTYDLEKYLSQSFRINGGSASIFIKKPIALFFLAVMVLMAVVPVIIKKVKAIKGTAKE